MPSEVKKLNILEMLRFDSLLFPCFVDAHGVTNPWNYLPEIHVHLMCLTRSYTCIY
jgi:hypothetical protein